MHALRLGLRLKWRLPLVALATLWLAGNSFADIPQVQVLDSTFGGSIWSESQRQAGVLFQDGGQSIPVPGGTLWMFGDTFYGPLQTNQPQNSAIKGSRWTTLAFLPAGVTNEPPPLQYFTNSDGLVDNAIDLLPREDSKHRRIWPLDGVHLGMKTYLYYSVIATTDDPGPWNFHDLGGGLSVADQPFGHFTRLLHNDHWHFPVEPIQVIQQGDLLYLMELSKKGLILARVEICQIEDPTAYRFCAGHGWSTNRADAKVILRDTHGQVSVMHLPDGGYLLATSSDFSRPHEIQLYRAQQLTGPWSAPARITVPDLPGQKTDLIYCTYLHPELSDLDSSRIVITYCRTLHGQWNLSNPEWAVLHLSL